MKFAHYICIKASKRGYWDVGKRREGCMYMKRSSMPGEYAGFSEKKYGDYKVTSQYVDGYDGTKLAVDIVRPVDENGKPVEEPLPVLLLISRGKRFTTPDDPTGPDVIAHCVPYGYVGVIAEMRGCGASYGTNNSFCSIENRQDVTAIINWIDAQSWCDGNVGTFGGSNRGLGQFTASVAKPEPAKALKAITPVVANADFYYQDYPNGVCALALKKLPTLSGSQNAPKQLTKEEVLEKVKPVDEDPNGDMAYEAYLTGQYGKNHGFMGWLLLPDMCRDDPNPNLGGEKTNLTIPPITDIDVFKKTDIKVHQFAGFIESGAFGQLTAAKEWGGSILVGPWDHRESRRGTKGFPEGMFDFKAEHLKWFDSCLKGKKNGFDEKPPFMYYTQNAGAGNYWRCSDTWPLESERMMTLYLSDEKSNTVDSVNDGVLSQTKPENESGADYKVDLSVKVFDDGQGGELDRMHMTWDGDMTPGVDKKGLTFTSAPLFRMYQNEITGTTPVDLWVSCTQKDADFILFLEEVFPDGRSKYVTMGCQRASHRTSEPREAWNECGATYHPCMRADMERCLEEGMDKPVHLQFHLEPISYVFQKGSRIRLTLVCSAETAFQHNIYDPENLPTVTLYQGGDHASFIRIPFVEHTENVYNGTVELDGETGPGTLYFFNKHTYLYANGMWHRYESNGPEMKYTMEAGKAVFAAGFTFHLEGNPKMDGILQHYEGGDKETVPFPAKRSQIVAQVPVTPKKDILFAPDVKTLKLEVFASEDGNKKAPCIVYIHGYSGTPSNVKKPIADLTKYGYTVIGIDLRNYPPNAYPDYVYDLKGNIRYIRAHAEELGVDPEKIAVYGSSLGGNSALNLACRAWDEETEGHVGGNEAYSSRVQAAVVGYGWSDILYMGQDLMEEYKDAAEALRNQKFLNSDGPNAPLAQVIDFAGEGKGMAVLREYMESGKEGTDPYLDGKLAEARKASPVGAIGPDCAPLALYGGLGMTSVDIPFGQTRRTFEVCGKYAVDCFLFCNTNGAYGDKPEVVAGIRSFLDHYLKQDVTSFKKTVMQLDSSRILENNHERKLEYLPVVCKENGIWISARYLKECVDLELSDAKTITVQDEVYVNGKALEGTGYVSEYYADKNMVVFAKEGEIPGKKVKSRTSK